MFWGMHTVHYELVFFFQWPYMGLDIKRHISVRATSVKRSLSFPSNVGELCCTGIRGKPFRHNAGNGLGGNL